MKIKKFTFNPFQENTYVLYDETGEAIVIDAGCFDEKEKMTLKGFIIDNHLILKQVINTHLHFDHQFGNKFLYENFHLKPQAHNEDEFLLENVTSQTKAFGLTANEEAQVLGTYIVDNQEIKFGNTLLKCIHVPGHSPGSLAFYCEKEKVIFVGDVLFSGSIGRTDLVLGSYDQLIASIKNKLMPLPDSVIVYSGHGPETTIGDEKLNNPFL